MLYSTTILDNEKVNEIKALENEIGKTVIALTGYNVRTTSLSEEQLYKVQEAEKKLGVVLVAVDA